MLDRCGSDDSNVDGDLDFTCAVPLTIVGTGPNVMVRQTCAGERVLDQHGAGLLTLTNLTVIGGSLSSASAEDAALGGGVRAQGDVRLARATLTGNRVIGAAGTPRSEGVSGSPGQSARGGGLFTAGSLIAVDSTLSNNTASGGPGADSSPTATATPGGSGEGGGAYVVGTATLRGGSLTSNRAAAETPTSSVAQETHGEVVC